MIFSPAMLKTFEQCPKKYYYRYVQGVSFPQNKFLFEKGKNIHAIASAYLNGFDVKKLESALNASEFAIWEQLKKNKFFNLQVINTEYTISSKISNYWIGGRLDAFVQNGEDYFILDYKTGSIPENPENDFQTMVYLICATKLLKNKFKSLKFVYLDLKNDEEKIIEFNNELRKKYETQIILICKAIEQAVEQKNFLKTKNKCNCDYYKICGNF